MPRGEPDAPAHRLAVATFGCIAFGLWPVLPPSFLARAERKPGRRRFLLGVAFAALYLLAYVASQLRWMVIDAKEHSLAHSITWHPVHDALDGTAMLTLFVSSLPRTKIAGLILLGAFIGADAIKHESGPSVWCCFAAGPSVASAWYIRRLERSPPVG